jgi:penicillin amidase
MRVVRWLLVLLLLALSAVASVLVWIWLSLPLTSGEYAVTGIVAKTTIARDARGIVCIKAESRKDAYFALGFAHASERYFEMDLARRQSAARLAELFGEVALPRDQALRPHEFEAVAENVLARTRPELKALLQSYSEGVNAGLASLRARPWPYVLLRAQPKPWQQRDSILVLIGMFLALNDEQGHYEIALSQLHEVLPEQAYLALVRQGTEFDSPLFGGIAEPVLLPSPTVFDFRQFDRHWFEQSVGSITSPVLGSNHFAIAGSRSADGRALLANDMHLGLVAPNIWFRAQWQYQENGKQRSIAGATLPGVPGLIVGSNGRIAFGLTNSYVDVGDWVKLKPGGSADSFISARGTERIETVRTTLGVGGREQAFEYRKTRLGPILHRDAQGLEWAYRFVAQLPELVNVEMLDLELADSLEQALSVAHASGTPPLNFLIADDQGDIAWTLIGRFPERQCGLGLPCAQPPAEQPKVHDISLPIASESVDELWLGALAPEHIPVLLRPAQGFLVTANQRVLNAEQLQRFGDGGYANGARAKQMHDALAVATRWQESDLLALQLDDRALFLTRWQIRLRALIERSDRAEKRELLRLLDAWGARASVDSVGYRLTREFRDRVIERITLAWAAPVRARFPEFRWPQLGQSEALVWQQLEQQPVHLLDPRFGSYEALQLVALEDVLAGWHARGAIAERNWGERNQTQIRHPLSRALPMLSSWLDMRSRALPGDTNMPRVQTPSFGASQRMVVSPGHESEGIFHMPGGQSGHPFSKDYGAGHEDWESGRASALFAGPEERLLILLPVAEAPQK